MNLLQDVITYIRRIVKTPSDASLSDNLIIDYINRFWTVDVDARLQLFDLKTKYNFVTIPGIDQYNMPLYSTQIAPGGIEIGAYPMYQGFTGNATINGIQIGFYTQKANFNAVFPSYTQQLIQAATGDGGDTYSFTLPYFPALTGHVDLSGIIKAGSTSPVEDPLFVTSLNTNIPYTSIYPAIWLTAVNSDGSNIVVFDSGQFLDGSNGGDLYGLLAAKNTSINGIESLGIYSLTSNTVNYVTGQVNVTFPESIPDGTPITASCFYYQRGLPRAVLFYNNILTLRTVPDKQYIVELDAYLTPAAFLNSSDALAFGYMAEYIARGAARKILSDTGDTEQFMFYEPLFREQESLVWKRSQRQFTSTRTETIYSNRAPGMGSYGLNGYGAF